MVVSHAVTVIRRVFLDRRRTGDQVPGHLAGSPGTVDLATPRQATITAPAAEGPACVRS